MQKYKFEESSDTFILGKLSIADMTYYALVSLNTGEIGPPSEFKETCLRGTVELNSTPSRGRPEDMDGIYTHACPTHGGEWIDENSDKLRTCACDKMSIIKENAHV